MLYLGFPLQAERMKVRASAEQAEQRHLNRMNVVGPGSQTRGISGECE